MSRHNFGSSCLAKSLSCHHWNSTTQWASSPHPWPAPSLHPPPLLPQLWGPRWPYSLLLPNHTDLGEQDSLESPYFLIFIFTYCKTIKGRKIVNIKINMDPPPKKRTTQTQPRHSSPLCQTDPACPLPPWGFVCGSQSSEIGRYSGESVL